MYEYDKPLVTYMWHHISSGHAFICIHVCVCVSVYVWPLMRLFALNSQLNRISMALFLIRIMAVAVHAWRLATHGVAMCVYIWFVCLYGIATSEIAKRPGNVYMYIHAVSWFYIVVVHAIKGQLIWSDRLISLIAHKISSDTRFFSSFSLFSSKCVDWLCCLSSHFSLLRPFISIF